MSLQSACGEPSEEDESSELLGERAMRGKCLECALVCGWTEVGAVEVGLSSTSMELSGSEGTVEAAGGGDDLRTSSCTFKEGGVVCRFAGASATAGGGGLDFF